MYKKQKKKMWHSKKISCHVMNYILFYLDWNYVLFTQISLRIR